MAVLSPRNVSERYELAYASRENVREWAHRLRSLFQPLQEG
ncbi:MAG: hypothetical protein QXD47_07060 [Candidatus Caldarchaeum sp.]